MKLSCFLLKKLICKHLWLAVIIPEITAVAFCAICLEFDCLLVEILGA